MNIPLLRADVKNEIMKHGKRHAYSIQADVLLELIEMTAAQQGVESDGTTTDAESFHAVVEMVNPDNPHWRKSSRRSR